MAKTILRMAKTILRMTKTIHSVAKTIHRMILCSPSNPLIHLKSINYSRPDRYWGIKQKKMAKQFYLPPREAEKAVWIVNFSVKVNKTGITTIVT